MNVETSCRATHRSATVCGHVFLVLALLSGCALMLPLWSAGPLALDEHGSYWIIDSDVPSHSLQRSLNYAAIPPLSGWLQQVFLAAAGKREWVFRFSSAVCYLAAIGLTFRLARTIADPVTSGLASLVLAWHPDVLQEVRIARCYGLVLLLSALFLWATDCWKRRHRSYKMAVVWGLIGAALLWTHYTTAPLIAVSWLSLSIAGKDWKEFGRPPARVWGLGMLVLCVFAIPLVPAILRLHEWSPYLNYLAGSSVAWKAPSSLWWLGLPVGWLAAASIAATIDRGTGQSGVSRAEIFTLLIWALLPVAVLTFSSAWIVPTLGEVRYRIPHAVAGACLTAVCVGSGRRPLAAGLGTLAALAATWAAAEFAPWDLGRLGHPSDTDWRDMAAIVERDGRPGQPVFVQGGLAEASLVPAYYDDPLFMEYAACRLGRFYLEKDHPRYALPVLHQSAALWDRELGVLQFYRDVLATHRRERVCWVASATDTDLNQWSLGVFQRILHEEGYRFVTQHQFPSSVLMEYEYRNSDQP